MRVPIGWLAEYVDVPAGTSVEDLDTAVVRLGLEVEEIHRPQEVTGPLVVGRVLDIEELTGFKKPIRYCQVDVGEAGPRGIVCGARNFAVGDAVVVALPGAVLPGGFEITARTTYDRVSDGMICSVRELGVGDDHAGLRSISLAVDVTNYVMIELGQPMHAFDRDAVQGPITVRLAREGEKLTTLDGTVRKLSADDLLITDDSGPIGLAAVMGGASTEISDGTTAVL